MQNIGFEIIKRPPYLINSILHRREKSEKAANYRMLKSRSRLQIINYRPPKLPQIGLLLFSIFWQNVDYALEEQIRNLVLINDCLADVFNSEGKWIGHVCNRQQFGITNTKADLDGQVGCME